MGDKEIMLRAVGCAEIDQFVDVVFDTGFTQDGVGYQGGSHAADGEPIGTRDSIDMVSGLAPASRRHVLHNDVRVSRNVSA